jgi:hypothetical protein
MIGTAVVGAGLGAYQTIEGAKQKKEARKALEDYKRQEFKNVGEGLAVSTLGADAQREEQARLASTQIDALKGAGTRGLISGLGRVEAGNQAVNDRIAASLDEKQKEIDMIVAEDDVRIRNMKENREIGDVSALSSQYNAGNEQMQQGIGNAVQGIGMAFNQHEKTDPTTDKKTDPTINKTTTEPTIGNTQKITNKATRPRRDVIGFDYYNNI